MEIEQKRQDDTCILFLTGDLTIYHAETLRNSIAAQFENCSRTAIDLSGIAETDTAGIQVLIWAKKESERKNHPIKLINHSPAIIRAIDLMGLIGFFGDKIKVPVEQRENYSFKYGVTKRDSI